ncbi:acyl-CoA dehydrogenase family protein [Agrococcus versicolor]|uniref:Acyl-CoA dehydrogenase family protein n=1 Tax=Agrococcus versicolor TaxID=501482 RepID=A0ABP5MMC5_9MICO
MSTAAPPIVLLGTDAHPSTVAAIATLAASAAAAEDRVGAALDVAGAVAAALPLPGAGATATLWSALASVAAIDLGVARTLEPHLDALAILAEAGASPAQDDAATWGVFAAEGAGHRLVAEQDGDDWRLTGSKPWCSLASRLDRALVTAVVDDRRGLFAVDLADAGVTVDDAAAWASHGLADVPSVPIRLDDVRAQPVGEPGWYLERPGFAWGGIGVAAIWHGGAVGVARTMRAAADRREPDDVALMLLGRVDRALAASGALLAGAASAIDAGAVDDAAVLALRARGVAAATVDEVLGCADRALGPAPLALDAQHARRVADLHIYARQHHADRDDVALGRALVATGARW